MAYENKVNLFHNELVLTNNMLYYGEHLIHDFKDKISNCSTLGADQQSKLFLTLVKMVYEAPLSIAHKAETVIMLADLFHILSCRNHSTDIMLLGESSFTGVFEYVLSRFHQNSFFYEVCPKKTMEPENIKNLSYITISSDYNLNSIPEDFWNEHRFGVIMIDYDAVQNNFLSLLEACSKLIRMDGKLLCYGSGVFDPEVIPIPAHYDGNLFQLEEECFLLELDIHSPSFTKSEMLQRANVLPVILDYRKMISDRINTLDIRLDRDNVSAWHVTIDEAIRLAGDLEQMISEHASLLIHKDLKYRINEVKNSLLDLKYEALLNNQDVAFFYHQVTNTFVSFCEAEL